MTSKIIVAFCRARLTTALLVGLLACTQMGCGDDAEPQRTAVCMGYGCTCGSGDACICTAGDDCKTTCEECSLSCVTGAKCNAEATGAVELDCNDNSECKGNGGDGSSISCRESSHCNLKGGSDSVATCTEMADCKLNLGPGSTVTCGDSASCDIKCDEGDCEVECGRETHCALNCGPEASGKAGTECVDGRLVCGRDC